MIDLITLHYMHPKVALAVSDFFRTIATIQGELAADRLSPARTDDATLAEVKDKIEAIIQTRQEPQPEEQAAPTEATTHFAPPAPPPPLSPIVSGAIRDSAGLPWDGRIHSSSKALLQDGTWRQKRGVDLAVLNSVTAELKAAMGAPAPTVAPAPAVTPAPPAPILAIVPPPPFVASVVPPAPPASTSPAVSAGAAPTASPSDGPITFPQLMRKITDGIISKAIDQPKVSAACETVGLPSIISLKDRPDLVEAVAAALGVTP